MTTPRVEMDRVPNTVAPICRHQTCTVLREYEWFIEGQAFSPSYDLAPRPPHSHSSILSTVFLRVAGRAYWQEREGRGGRGAKKYDLDKSFIPLWLYCTVLFKE